MYNEKKDKGFVVMAFPCNQFGGQEPENEEAIKHIVTSKYKVNFNLFAKVRYVVITSTPTRNLIHLLQIDVNGPNTHPVYKFLKTCFPGDITWNFSSKVRRALPPLLSHVSACLTLPQQFLINRDGVPIARFEKEPWSEISAAIDELLEAPASSSSSAAPSASSAKI